MYPGEMTSALGLEVLSWVYLAQPSLSKLAAHLQSCNKLGRFVSPRQTVLGQPEMEEAEMSSYSYSPGSPAPPALALPGQLDPACGCCLGFVTHRGLGLCLVPSPQLGQAAGLGGPGWPGWGHCVRQPQGVREGIRK